jgi:adenylate cyclase
MLLRPLRARDRLVVFAGGLCLIAAALFMAIDPGETVRGLRERAFDTFLVWSPRVETSNDIMVVDIDRDALAAVGPWPWPRERLADLIERIAAGKPKALAIDILLVSKKIGAAGSSDRRLADAIARVPTVLAVVLDPEPSRDAVPSTPIAVGEDVKLPDLMITAGIAAPAPALVANAQGFGVISLPAPGGEPVRAVPLLAGGANALLAGLAAETVRVAAGDSTMIAAAAPQRLRIGDYTVPLPSDGFLRIHFSSEAHRKMRSIPAHAFAEGKIDTAKLAGKIVFLGASAPEAGGLRRTAIGGFTPSVQIQAEAAEQIILGHVPIRSAGMDWAEIAAALALGIGSIMTIVLLPPGRSVIVILCLLLAWFAIAIGLTTKVLWLTDPVSPILAALFAAQGAGLTHFGLTYRQRVLIERRFAHHLPAAVVRRIADNPHELRLAGELRTITVLTTDIEGFTALTERLKPEALVALLDRYIDLVVGIVVDHGGMVDKLIGDAVHAYFNAPLDLPAHAEKAVACACAIIAATEELRKDPQIAPAGLGRTRIGIETGPAILGEVGRGAKRDYTAYGHAVNMASRLEQINKQFDSSIVLGPGTVAALNGKVPIRCLGRVAIRGIDGEVEVFEPQFRPANKTDVSAPAPVPFESSADPTS